MNKSKEMDKLDQIAKKKISDQKQENPDSSKSSQQVVLHAVAMAFGTLSSRILGLVREQAFAALFDKTITDAWIAAFRLPNLFRRLLGEGALSVSFIPVFVESRLQDPSLKKSHQLVNSFYTLLLVVLSVLTALGIFFAKEILELLLDPNYVKVSEKFDLTLKMAQIMFVFVFLVSTYAYFMGILNALGKFAWAATAPTFFNLAMIISTLSPQNLLRWRGETLAWGVVVGGFLQVLVLVPSLIKLGYLPKFSFKWNSPEIKKIAVNMLPSLAGMGLLQITTLINLRFASQLKEGSISYINWADRLLELPLSLISVSLGAALLPTLSKMWSSNEKQKMVETGHYYLRLNLFLSLPAALALYFLALPIVQLLFERGKFTATDSLITATVVQVYAFTMISTSCVRVLVPNFYAIKNTWLPALASAISLGVHIIIAPLLMKRWGLYGLNASSTLSSSLNLIFLLSAYPFFIGNFYFLKLFRQLGLFFLAGLAMAAALLIYFPVESLLGKSFFIQLLNLIFSCSLGIGAYFLVSYWLKLDEYQKTIQIFLNKIRSKL